VTGLNDVVYNAAWWNDTWKVSNRLTLNLGLRFEAYRDGWPEQDFTPNGHPQLANWTDQRYRDFVAPRTVEARTVAETRTLVPRLGFAYDLTGDNRTVLKVYFGQSRWNSADTLANQENPVGRAMLRYQFLACTATRTANCDLNGNRLVDGPQELGNYVSTQGGGGSIRIDRDLVRPTNNEISTNVEREIVQGLSGRVSYVYKNMRNIWAEVDVIRAPAYTVPYTLNDPGPDNVAGTGDDQTFQTFDRPPSTAIGEDRVWTNPEGNNADFHNVELAVNRRFSNRWMLLTSFGYTWSNMLHETTGYGRFFNYRPAERLFGDNGWETSTIWNYKVIGRYVLPYDVGLSGSWKVQSGQQYGRTVTLTFPGDSQQTVRVEPITTNRYPTVGILDFRLDKSIKFGRFGRLTGMVDVFNAANSGVPTDFRETTVNYREVTELLDPRVVRFGLRFEF